jgi:CheY-like chemotaxis protein
MSHELRTPLNAIIGFAELLVDGAVPPDSPQHREFLGDILSSGRHLLQLINDVLDVAKVEAGALEFRPEQVNIVPLIAEIVSAMHPAAISKQLRIVTDVDPGLTDLLLDPSRLKQVVYNYVSNAVKFSPPGATITVRVQPENADSFRIEVKDEGVGIAPGDLGKLFVEFQQLHAGTAKPHQGTGLGLALTKRMVQAQGGVVGVESTLGQGSNFYAILPRRIPGVTEVVMPRVTTRERAERRGLPTVLVVEDDADDRAQLVTSLTMAGFHVEAVATGSEALVRWRDRLFDAATIDLLLSDMSGLDLLSALAKDPRSMGVPLIVVTAVPEASVASAVAGFELHDLLHKPLDPNHLLDSLARAGLTAQPGVAR